VLRLLAASFLLGTLAAGCGSGEERTAEPGQATTLAEVKRACEDSFTPSSPGRARVESELRDAGVDISIEAPCLITLAPAANVMLDNVTITSRILNLVDDPSEAGENRIELQQATMNGQPESGFLVELRDPGDTLEVDRSTLDYPRGIVFRIFGHRDDENSGGFIRMERTSLAAADDAEGVALLTSEHTGVIKLVETTIATPAGVVLIADQCEALLDGEELDCSVPSVAKNLERQAEEIGGG
jgi:hypothetical protein